MSGPSPATRAERWAWSLIARADMALARVQFRDRRIGVLMCSSSSFHPHQSWPWVSIGPARDYRTRELCGAYLSAGPHALLVTASRVPEWSRTGRLVSRSTPWPGLRAAA